MTPTNGANRRALVTGASAGLGAEFARQLAAAGCALVLVARRRDRLEKLAAELTERHGIDVCVLEADLADAAAPAVLVARLKERGLQIDMLVNNAGAAGPDLLTDRDWQAHERYQQLMMTSAAALTHLLVPGMQERGYGRVLNVASMAGRLMRANDTSYGPAKAWLIAHSEALAATLRGTDVLVMALCPGFTRTEFHAQPHMHGLRDAIPDWLWYDSEVVVREGLAALERGKVVYASGRLYRWADPLTQFPVTRWLLRGLRRGNSQG